MYYRCCNYLITASDSFLGFQAKLNQRIQTYGHLINILWMRKVAFNISMLEDLVEGVRKKLVYLYIKKLMEFTGDICPGEWVRACFC
jgi:hypothetical protein